MIPPTPLSMSAPYHHSCPTLTTFLLCNSRQHQPVLSTDILYYIQAEATWFIEGHICTGHRECRKKIELSCFKKILNGSWSCVSQQVDDSKDRKAGVTFFSIQLKMELYSSIHF